MSEVTQVQAGLIEYLARNTSSLPALELRAEHFSHAGARRIFAAIAEAYEDGLSFDGMIGAMDFMRDRGNEDHDAFIKLLNTLEGIELVPDSDNGIPPTALRWARILRKDYARHEARRAAVEAHGVVGGTNDPAEMLRALQAASDRAKRAVSEVDPTPERKNPDEIIDAMLTTNMGRVSIGYPRLTGRMKGGPFRGAITTIMGKPGTGKSTLAANIIEQIATQAPHAHLVVSTHEMSLEEWTHKHALSILGATDEELQQHPFTPEQRQRLRSVLRNVHVWDDLTTVRQIHGRCARLPLPPLFVVIDYLGQLEFEGARNPYQRVSENMRAIKRMARQLGTRVILLSQVSRERRSPEEPVTLSDARDAGTIEEESDFLAGLHRPNFYEEIATQARIADVNLDLLKCKVGYPGRIEWRLDLPYQRFEEVPRAKKG